MRKYLLAVWLITCISGVTQASRVFAVDQTQSEPPKVTLYGADSLRGSLSEVADAFTQEYGISVNREFCLGGLSETLRLAGEVKNPITFDLQKLIDLQEDLKKQDPSVATEVTVSFQTGSGPRTETYYGVPLWELINNEKAAGGLQGGNSGQNPKNAFLR